MKAYITCPASLNTKHLDILPVVEALAQKNGIEIFVFQISDNPEEIFKRDYKQIKGSDLIIAEVSEPSHGVGVELGLSYLFGHQIILLLEKGKKLSRLVLGIPDSYLVEYSNKKELKQKLDKIFKELNG